MDFLKIFNIPNKVYDILKWVVIIVLPAFGTFYSTLGGIWGLPYANEIVKTISAITLFLGAVLCISTAQYNKTKVYTPKNEQVESSK